MLILLGYLFVFLAINALAIAVFPSSLVFPFVLIFCGCAFIYAGMTFDKDEWRSAIEVNHTTGNEGNIVRWTGFVVDRYVLPIQRFSILPLEKNGEL